MSPLAISAADYLPHQRDLETLRMAAAACQGCALFAQATQTVFGTGPDDARVVLIGEQPGDVEDRRGEPFIGPAGQVLDRVLEEVGIERKSVYVTNAVKHFKWRARGRRRLHAKPSAREIAACRPWLEAELNAIRPQYLVCLGATAAQSLLGPKFQLTKRRGQPFSSDWAPWTMATYHPSALLRAHDSPAGRALQAAFHDDLRQMADAARAGVTGPNS